MSRIVLIEDDEMDAKTFANLCVDRGITSYDGILVYPNAEAFLSVAEAKNWEEDELACIFVDLQLDEGEPSDRSGLRAADAIRRSFREVPLVAYTRHYDAYEITRLTLHAFDGIMIKLDFSDKKKFGAEQFREAVNAWRKKRGLAPVSLTGGEPGGRARPVILHLSDPQFGRAVAEGKRLADDVVAAVEEDPPNIVIVSGDIGQTGRPEEYGLAREFLERLCSRLGIGEEHRRQVVLCAGNHDVNWLLADGFVSEDGDAPGGGEALQTEESFFYRLAPFYDFYREFYGANEGSCLESARRGFDVFDLRGFGVVVVSINSSWHEHRASRGGVIPSHVFDGVEKALERFGGGEGVMRMATFHHPLQVGVGGGLMGGQQDLIEDPTGVTKRLANLGVEVVFTGHLHGSSVEEININFSSKKGVGRIFNLLAGSVGVPEEDRPNVGGFGHLPNDFGVLRQGHGGGGWEYEAFSLDPASRSFLPKPKFNKRSVLGLGLGVD